MWGLNLCLALNFYEFQPVDISRDKNLNILCSGSISSYVIVFSINYKNLFSETSVFMVSQLVLD